MKEKKSMSFKEIKAMNSSEKIPIEFVDNVSEGLRFIIGTFTLLMLYDGKVDINIQKVIGRAFDTAKNLDELLKGIPLEPKNGKAAQKLAEQELDPGWDVDENLEFTIGSLNLLLDCYNTEINLDVVALINYGLKSAKNLDTMLEAILGTPSITNCNDLRERFRESM